MKPKSSRVAQMFLKTGYDHLLDLEEDISDRLLDMDLGSSGVLDIEHKRGSRLWTLYPRDNLEVGPELEVSVQKWLDREFGGGLFEMEADDTSAVYILMTPRGKSHFRMASTNHDRSISLMKFLSRVARRLGVGEHAYVVGGAVRNWILKEPIKDIDVVFDSIGAGGKKDSHWFAKEVARAIPTNTNVTTNQYGVAIITVKGEWVLDGVDLNGEVIEIANSRKESYGGAGGKGNKPTDVQPATIEEDVNRREFRFNTLLMRLQDLAHGPEGAEIIDLTGYGKSDLEDRLIQTPVDPDVVFSDDPTRMLRALKFLLRYDMKIPPDVRASIQRNAPKLRNMPWEAVAKILVGDILNSPKARMALMVMDDLGIVPVLAEMAQEVKPFSAYLTRQMASGNRAVDLLLDLMDRGVDTHTLGFLTSGQRDILRVLTLGMDPTETRALLDSLKNPDIDSMALIQEFNLQGRDRGLMAPIARDLLLVDPSLVRDPVSLNDGIRKVLKRTRMATTRKADLNPPLGMDGGPCRVVDRIEKNVRDDRTQDALEDKVESGIPLSNSEAHKIYPASVETGGVFKKFSISSHAQYRMDLRSVTVAHVRASLESLAKQLKFWRVRRDRQYDDMVSAQGSVSWLDPRSKLFLALSMEPSGDGFTADIITAYWKGRQDPPPTECSAQRVAFRYLVASVPSDSEDGLLEAS